MKIAIAILVLATLGTMDYQDQNLMDRQYCENVASGAWGAYRGDVAC